METALDGDTPAGGVEPGGTVMDPPAETTTVGPAPAPAEVGAEADPAGGSFAEGTDGLADPKLTTVGAEAEGVAEPSVTTGAAGGDALAGPIDTTGVAEGRGAGAAGLADEPGIVEPSETVGFDPGGVCRLVSGAGDGDG